MMGAPTGARIWLAAGFTDLRKGFDGLSALVQTALNENPYSVRFSCSGDVGATKSRFSGIAKTGCVCFTSVSGRESLCGLGPKAARCV